MDYTNEMFLDILLPYSTLSWRKTVWIYFSPPLTVNEKNVYFQIMDIYHFPMTIKYNLELNYYNIQRIKYMLYFNIIEFNVYNKSSSCIKSKYINAIHVCNAATEIINHRVCTEC